MVRAYEAKIRQRDAEVLIAKGAFDTSLNLDSYNRTKGYYDGKYSKLSINKPIRDFGAQIEGGYRIGNEEFPVYEQDLETLDGGEMFLSLTLPVLRNLLIDPQRALLAERNLGVKIAEEDVRSFRLKLYMQAAKAYWSWIEKGNTLDIISSIVDIAQVRMDQLEHRSKLGDLPQLDAIDARRALMKRKADQTSAKQSYITSAKNLSLYLRDKDGNPVDLEKYDYIKPPPLKCSDISDKEKLLNNAYDNRPELRVINFQIQQMEVSLEQAKNELMPKLDLKVTGQDDVGSGSDRLDEPELKVGALFSVPLERSVARGKIEKAEQAISELKSNLQFVKDQIDVEVSLLYENFKQTCAQLTYVEKEALGASDVAEGERQKLNQGDSSLVIVNLREEDVAEAASRVVKTKTDLHTIMAELIAAQALSIP